MEVFRKRKALHTFHSLLYFDFQMEIYSRYLAAEIPSPVHSERDHKFSIYDAMEIHIFKSVRKSFDFWSKFRFYQTFLTKIFNFYKKLSIFSPEFRFFARNTFFARSTGFNKNIDFYEEFLLPKFRDIIQFLTKLFIFGENFDF